MRNRAILFLLGVLLILPSPAHTQRAAGKASLGLRGGANVLLNDFNKRKVGPGGEVVVSYAVAPALSFGLAAGYEELKARQDPPLDAALLGYDYVKLHSIPLSFRAWVYPMPAARVSPYLFVGAGVTIFQRKDGGGSFIPNDKFVNSVLFPMGAGIETYLSSKVSIVTEASFAVGDDRLDGYEYANRDSYASAKAGLNFHLGSGPEDDDDADGLTNGEERRLGTNPEVADSDGDGLKDGEEVKRYNTNPLAADTDADGLTDGDEAIRYNTDPARNDSDEDGISDGDEILKHKTDPTKPDTDGDGLADGDELLRYSSSPLKLDTDDDGVSDWDEVKTFRSDPTKTDSDSDGLTDGDEVRKHKTDPTKVDSDNGGVNDGAEITRGTNPLSPKDDTTEKTIVLEKGKSVVLEGVTFETGSARLSRESERTLEKAFIALVANPDVVVEVAGYTDNVGRAAGNQQLSRRRAEAVRAWLVRKGIGPERLTAVGKGMEDPVASNDTPEGRAQNRRIEFHVQK
ncbi:MAG: OmpA family protein [Bacteroidota bacterium]